VGVFLSKNTVWGFLPKKLKYLKKYKNNQFSKIIILIIICSIFFIISFKTQLLTSGFRYFIDDHQIAVIHSDLANRGFLNTVVTWIGYDKGLYRFRPYYQFQMVTLTQVFGLNPLLWFLTITILGSLTTLFLFIFARLLKFSFWISIIFSVSTLLGIQSEVYARPMIPDAYGMFFLSASLVFLGLSSQENRLTKLNNFIFIFLVLLMSLCKESYILFIPTLIIIKLYSYGKQNNISLRQSFEKNRNYIVALLVILFLEMSYIIFFLGTTGTGYAGVDASSLQIENITSTTRVFLEKSHFEIPLILILLNFIINFLRKEKLKIVIKKIAPFILIFFTSIIPHILLYSKSGILGGYYLFPAILGCSLLMAQSLFLLEENYKFLAKLLITIIAIIFLYQEFTLVLGMYDSIAKDAKETNALFRKIELCIANNEQVLVVTNPRGHYEASLAIREVLNFALNKDNLLIATYGLEKTHFFSEYFKEVEQNLKFLNPEDVVSAYGDKTILNTQEKDKIKAIVMFNDLNDDFVRTSKNWFFKENYDLTNFKIAYDSISLYCQK
jgi:hypothetical protein